MNANTPSRSLSLWSNDDQSSAMSQSQILLPERKKDESLLTEVKSRRISNDTNIASKGDTENINTPTSSSKSPFSVGEYFPLGKAMRILLACKESVLEQAAQHVANGQTRIGKHNLFVNYLLPCLTLLNY
jgi:hypothetical protein